MKALIKRIRRLLYTRRTRGQLRRVISIVACIVVFATTYALVLPAITMETVARCGKEAHEHTAGCYEKVLICREPESDGHHHTDDCYRIEKVLDCKMEEHTHGPECRDAEGNLICENAEHIHVNACYREERELICGLEESEGHHHTDACYENRLICGKEVHIHSPECYENDESASQDDFFAGGDPAGFTEDNSAGSTFADDGFTDDGSADSEFSDNDFSDGGITFSDSDQEFTEPDGFDGADEFIEDAGPEDGSGFMETQGLEDGTVFEDPAYAEDGSYPEDPAADNQYDDTAYTEEIDDGAVPAAAGETLEDEYADPAVAADAETPDGTEAVNPDEAGVSTEPEENALNGDPAGQTAEEQNPDGSAAADIEAADMEKEAQSGEEAGEAGTEKTAEADSPDAAAKDGKTAQDGATEQDGKTTQDGAAADTEKTGTASDKENTDGTDAASDKEKADGKETDAAEADTALTDQTGADKEQDSFAAADQLQAPADLERFLTNRTGIWYYPAVFNEDGKADTADINSESVTDWKKVEDDTVLSPEDFVRIFLAYTLPAGTLSETNPAARYTLPSNLHLTPAQIEAINTHENGYYLSLGEDDAMAEEGHVEGSMEDPADTPGEEDPAQGDRNASEAIPSEEENPAAGPDAQGTERRDYLGAEAVEGERTPDQPLKDQKEEYISAVVKAEEIYDESGTFLGQELVFTFLPYTVEKNGNVYEDTSDSSSLDDAEPSDELIREGEAVTGFLTIDFATGQIDFEDTETENIKTAEITFAHENETEGTGFIHESLTMNSSADFRKTQEIKTDQESEEIPGSGRTEEKTPDDKTSGGENDTSDEKDADKEENEKNTKEESKEGSDKDAAHKAAADLPADAMPARTFEDSITLETARPASVGETGTIAEAAGTLSSRSEVRVRVEADEGTFPAGTTMVLSAVSARDMDAVAEAVESAVVANADTENKANGGNAKSPQTCGFQAVDISFRDADGNEIEPAKPVRVVMTSSLIKEAAKNDTISAPVVVHVDNKGKGEQIDLVDPEKIEAAKGKTEEELIKEAEASREIEKNTGAEDKTEEESKSESEADKVSAEDSVGYETDRFSIYAIVYTVDFHYEVNGKEYEFSLPGGGFVSFTDLVEVLGIIGDTNSDNNGDENGPEIADNAGENAASEGAEENGVNSDANMLLTLGDVEVSEATRKFVADVASVEFSDPELVWIKKVNTETTVSELKQANKIVCQYSAELTKEQINEINTQSVRAGDWALISMFPFTSEETLTITMKDGKQYVVKVTDAQISTNVLTADGITFCITVNYDDSAEIPVGTRLVAEEIDQKSVEFIQRVSETLAEVNKGYFEEQELLKKGVDPDTIEHVQPVSMDQARFFHVSLMHEGRKIEPKTPVRVDIKYVDGLGVEEIAERIPGVSYITDDTVEVISEVKTETDKEGRIIEFEYTQDSFSDIGTFIGHEGHNGLMKASAPGVNLRGSGTDETSTIEDFIAENGAPEASKVLNDNGDGTYTLALHVKPQSSEYTKIKKTNVLFIMDRSSSMTYDSEASYVEFANEADAIAAVSNGMNVYGYINTVYTALSYVVTDFGGMWTSPSGVYDISNGLYYGLSGSRFSQEQAALGNLINQLMLKNEGSANDTENVEISIMSFSTYAGNDQLWTYVGGTSTSNWGTDSDHPTHPWGNTEVGWTSGTDATALINGVYDLSMARGTNWEEALRQAKLIMDAKKQAEEAAGHDDEDYFVVFLTDGAPTATSWSITQRDPTYEWGAYYGNNTTHPDGTPAYLNNEGIPYAYDPARDDARAIVAAGYSLFNIFTYGAGNDYRYMERLTNYAYTGGNDAVSDPLLEAYSQYFKNATNTTELVDYLNHIFKEITGNIGHSQVKIKDGLTQGAMTSTFVNGKPSAVHYTVTPGQGSSMLPYTVQATMPEEGTEPIVTFTINGQNYTTTSGAVQKKVNPADAYDAGEYYYVKVGNVEYKMALASVEGPGEHEGELTWDLTPMGILWDDCDYKAEFVVWPKQEAYNYVAGLNNEMPGFDWNQETANEHEHIDSQGRKYWSHGVDGLDSIVKYEDGTFAVLTNTHQELEYSVAKVEDEDLKEKTDPTNESLDFPDPMPLNSTRTNLEKQWSVDRNPAILAQYLYNPDGSPTKFVAEFDISSDNDTNPFATVSLGWDKDLEQYVWDDSSVRRVVYNGHVYHIGTRWSDEINIATGLMVTGDRLEALGLNPNDYPKGIYGETIYYILERGHDYHVKESTEESTEGEGTGGEGTEGEGTEGEGTAKKGLGYEFDFESPVFHPMLVNGRMMNIIFENEMDEETLSLINPYPIDQMIPAPMNSIGSLVVENTLRGYINVEKIVVDKDGKTKLPNDTTQFSYDVVLENTVLDPAPFTEDDNNVPWYGINGLFYHGIKDGEYNYYEATPLGGNRLSLLTESGETVIAETEGDAFDKDSKGPTRIRIILNEEEGQYGDWFDLHGNEMFHDSDSHVHDTIQIRQGQTLNIANVPKGTEYTITESILDPNYDLMSIVWGIKDGDETIRSGRVEDISSGSITGTIVSNRDNHITFTNKIHSADLKVKKVDENGKGLLGAKFTLTKTIVDPETEAQTWTLPEPGTADTGIYTFADLPDGVYTLTETPPPNYTGVAPITFAVANGVIYMPGDTLPAGVTLPDDASLPGDVIWENNNNKTFSLKIPNVHIQPPENEIRVEKRWVDQNGNTAEGSRDVKVQLRRKKLDSHDVTVVFHSDGWSGGEEINDSTIHPSIAGDQITIEFTKPTRFAQNVAPPVSSTSGTVQGPVSNGTKWKIVVSGVSSDITVTIDYSGYNWQLVNQNNRPPIQDTEVVTGNGQGGNDFVPDDDFPAAADLEKATKTLTAPDYYASWKFGEGSSYDFPAAGYQYYLVELDQNDQPIQEGQGGLVSITNNNGITTGIITATNKIDGSLTLKKQLGSLPSDDVSHAAGKYNFTVTGPGEPGTRKYVQIRIDAAGTVTYKVSNQEISFDETVGFVNAPSDGTVLIPNLVAGKYKVTEGEYRLDDQDGKYSTSLGKIEVESGTADLSTGSATLNVRSENTPSAAATFTNMLVPMVEVPVVKNWQWSNDDGGRVASWTATFNLEYREVLVDGEAASDAQHSWAPVYDTDGTTQKSVTIRSQDDPKEKFTNLPLYKTHDNGSIYRLIYAVDEVAYTINWNDGSPSTTWSKNESGHLSEHYSPDYEQDAGESEQPENQEDWDEWYTIRLKNVKSTREIEKTIDLSLEKVWEDEALQSDPDSKATFQLRRTYHEEYLDYDKDGRDLSNKPEVTVTLDLGNGLTKQLVVPKTAPVYISAVVKPGEIINLRFNKEGSTIALTGGDSNSTGQQFITTADPFEADDITVSLASGNTSALMGGLDGIGLASFDPGETTEEQADEAFNHPMSEDGQSAGQKFTLDAEHGWRREWAGLPQIVEELSVTDSGTRMKTIVYSYYLVEIEEECYPKNYEVSFRNGQGDEVNPLISSGSVVAANKLEMTELSGTKTWSLDEETSYVLGTPILKLSRRTETTTVDGSGNPVTILSEPEDVTVSWEGEEQFLQPTWHSDGGFTRSFTYTDLPKTDKDGNTYVYSVEEVEFTVGAGENAVVYTAVRQPDGSYIVTPDKEGAKMFVVTQTGNDISNELHNTTIEIVKIDESTRGASNPDRLANAWFRLLVYNGNTYVGYDGIYGAVDGVPVGGIGEEQGKLAFENLPDGEYKIVETKMPDGYIKETDNSIYFGIKGGTVTRYDGPVSNDESVERNPIPAKVIVDGAERDNVIASISFEPDNNTFTVGNTPGAALPNTGGPGTRLFTILGSILILGAGVLLWRRRRLI